MSIVLRFGKFHGAGNDFVMVDGRDYPLLPAATIASICDRHRGIGADGLIILHPEQHGILRMNYYNADGRESTLCGNGGRCAAAWANKQKLAGQSLELWASDGLHQAKIIKREGDVWQIRLQMADLAVPQLKAGAYFINTGSPHHIQYVEDIETTDVHNLGRGIRYTQEYAPEGTNVNFVQRAGDLLLVRTYERGVEAETLACGTGTTAVALTEAWLKQEAGPGCKRIAMPGGHLAVDYEAHKTGFRNVWLEGPATYVFQGEIILPEHG